MSARDLFVIEEELDACLGGPYAPLAGACGEPAGAQAEPEATQPACAEQFAKDDARLRFLVKHILPALVIGLVVAFSAVNGDSGSARERASSIPAPCRG